MAIRAAKSGAYVPGDRIEAARQLLLVHHGTRGAAAEAMAGGFTTVANKRNGMDWLCTICSKDKPDDNPWWVWKKFDACGKCGKKCTKRVVRYKDWKAPGGNGKAAAGNGAGGKGGAKGGQGGNNADAEIRKLREQVRKLEQDKEDAEDDGDEEEDEDENMDTDVMSKAELERSLGLIEADIKYAEGMLKTNPKHPRYLGWLDMQKSQAANVREKLRELKDPVDQLRHKGERLKRIADKEKKCRESLREACKAMAEAEEEVASLREQIHDLLEEAEQVKSEQKVLVLQGCQQEGPAAPVDLGSAVGAMRKDFTEMFADATLPQSVSSKKEEVEAGFVTMASLVGMLSSFAAEYKAAKLQAATAAATPPAHPSPPVLPPQGGAVPNIGAEADQQPAAVGTATAVAAPATRDSNNSQEERNSNRERTPPPSKGGAKAVAKKTDDELLGPRRPKQAKAEGQCISAGARESEGALN